MYRLHFNEHAGLLEATLSGFWTVETIDAFHEAMTRLIETYAPRFPDFPMLSDSRDFDLLTTEASEHFAAKSREAAARHSGKVAIVVKSSLKKMQAQRVVANWDRRFFNDMAEARQWLLGR